MPIILTNIIHMQRHVPLLIKAYVFKARKNRANKKKKKKPKIIINKKTMKSLFFLLPILPIFALFFFKNLSILNLFPLLITLVGLYYGHNNIWLKPYILRRKLRKQGIKGPSPSFLYGNVREMQEIQAMAIKAANFGEFIAHDYTSTLFPYFEKWRQDYGQIYTYSTGNKQHLYVNHPEMVKEMNQSVSKGLGKPSYVTKRLAPMLGNGILRSNGHLWSQQRKIVAPEFYMDKVKGLVNVMLESTEPLISKWEETIDAQINGDTKMAEIRVEEDLRGLSGDVISRACFGSSYNKGKKIFSKLRNLQKIIANQGVLFGNSTLGFLPNKDQKEIQNLEKEIQSLIWETVVQRKEECEKEPSSEKDLLQLILEGAINAVGKECSKNFIVDNCKSIYFAGHESTAVAASWCLMLLALHPEWQERIREETEKVCPNGVPDAESLSKLKMVTMVIHEVLRLYPPAAFVSREALEDTQIAHIKVPKGVCIWTLIPTLHRDPNIWGQDANEFKPQRFENGISNACTLPQVYIPFGVGPRLCLGRNFALAQLKIVLTLIISKFSFTLSPKYRHTPAYRMIVEPGQGVTVLMQRCSKK